MKTDKLAAEELKMDIYNAQHGKCYYCRKRIAYRVAQLAHRIPKHKKYVKKYGAAVIHNRRNMVITCDRCNSKALLDPATHPLETAELIAQINYDIGVM